MPLKSQIFFFRLHTQMYKVRCLPVRMYECTYVCMYLWVYRYANNTLRECSFQLKHHLPILYSTMRLTLGQREHLPINLDMCLHICLCVYICMHVCIYLYFFIKTSEWSRHKFTFFTFHWKSTYWHTYIHTCYMCMRVMHEMYVRVYTFIDPFWNIQISLTEIWYTDICANNLNLLGSKSFFIFLQQISSGFLVEIFRSLFDSLQFITCKAIFTKKKLNYYNTKNVFWDRQAAYWSLSFITSFRFAPSLSNPDVNFANFIFHSLALKILAHLPQFKTTFHAKAYCAIRR